MSSNSHGLYIKGLTSLLREHVKGIYRYTYLGMNFFMLIIGFQGRLAQLLIKHTSDCFSTLGTFWVAHRLHRAP